MSDRTVSGDAVSGRLACNTDVSNGARATGWFTAICRDADGNELWQDTFPNLLTTVGKNLLLDTTLAGSSYTVSGPFMGLMSSSSFSGPAAGDTMGAHSGWLEAGTTNAPTYAARQTCAWSAASNGTKTLSAALTFTFTGSGTVSGVFVVTGANAVSTNLSTAGTLYSAAALTTAQPVISGNTLTLSYSSTLT